MGILERRLLRARTETVEADVHRQRHSHIDRSRPELVVLRLRIRLAVREHAEVHPFKPKLRAVVKLRDRIVEVRPRDDAEADQPVGRDRAVLLAEPVVVRTYGCAIDVLVGERAPEPRTDLHVRKQDLRVQAVGVLLLQALLRRPHAGRVVDICAERHPGLVRAARPQVEERRGVGRLALDEQRVAAVGQLDRARRLLAQARRHPRRPALGTHFEVTVARDQWRKRGSGHEIFPPSAMPMVHSLRAVVFDCGGVLRGDGSDLSYHGFTMKAASEENRMKVALVGLPQSGKTSLFKALTGTEPTREKAGMTLGTVKVPDARVDKLSEMYRPKKTTHAVIELVEAHAPHKDERKANKSAPGRRVPEPGQADGRLPARRACLR